MDGNSSGSFPLVFVNGIAITLGVLDMTQYVFVGSLTGSTLVFANGIVITVGVLDVELKAFAAFPLSSPVAITFGFEGCCGRILVITACIPLPTTVDIVVVDGLDTWEGDEITIGAEPGIREFTFPVNPLMANVVPICIPELASTFFVVGLVVFDLTAVVFKVGGTIKIFTSWFRPEGKAG